MSEEMTEDQILDAISRNSGLDPEPEQQPQSEAAPETLTAPETTEAEVEVTASEEETQTLEIDPDEPLFEQEVVDGGKKSTQKLSLKELQAGYLRQRDYTQKTQELAKQRDELPRAYAKHAQDISESYTKRLSELQQLAMKTVAAELAGVDWERLATDDPLGYPAKFERRVKLEKLLQTIQAEQKDAEARVSQEQTKTKAEKWQKSLEILHREIPDFGPDVAKRLVESGKEWGFEPDEVAQWDDHRIIKMLHALSDKKAIESKKPEVEKKVALVTKTLKPGAKSAARPKFSEDMARFKKSGKLEDGYSAFDAILNRR